MLQISKHAAVIRVIALRAHKNLVVLNAREVAHGDIHLPAEQKTAPHESTESNHRAERHENHKPRQSDVHHGVNDARIARSNAEMNHEAKHEQNRVRSAKHDVEQEQDERLVIPHTDAPPDPDAVMVHPQHTLVTHAAMMHAWRLLRAAPFAVSSGSGSIRKTQLRFDVAGFSIMRGVKRVTLHEYQIRTLCPPACSATGWCEYCLIVADEEHQDEEQVCSFVNSIDRGRWYSHH
mmetsp:Transcript_329/g.627  ORF Transcript_329/g.627 Transcript_329/m.627 type:complete len:235 (-) Transcript_329:488-1192(-)|eukprot:CAMPEP_0185857372 /NCGR_PEP_ID=MMETSP1354-20130828/29474_1 /TAXON_ID=708628 /ORGANISM="Erythrolobus madagascarensis, Strain CCMP3276" /LENGTH=234 /DNA_ID=CAMNT_0028559641 /DNA_START=816 /DNA_END=1520 /DNA_ORIENTATION=-